LLRVHQIYLKTLIIIFLFLFIVLGVEVYSWTKELYLAELNSLNLPQEIINSKLEHFDTLFVKFSIEISLLLLIFAIIVYLFISKIDRALEKEVQNVLMFLKSLTKKKKMERIDSNFSKEFKDITKLLTKVARILIKQDRENMIYTSKLELSNIQKDEIISAISHEFKNPITIINGYSQTLIEDETIPPTLRREFLLKIKRNGEKLSTLIDKLRLSIRLDNNREKLTFSKIDINELLESVIEEIKNSYQREIVLEKAPLSVNGDRTLMEILFSNLIENAIKYSEEKVVVKVNKNSVSVIDSGVGIKEEDLGKITEKFYRVGENHWNNSLGLGLSIVLRIVKLHNFELIIESEFGKGSEFKVKMGK